MTTATRLCAFPECGKPARKAGLCWGHYDQKVKGKPLKPIKRGKQLMRNRTCAVDGCESAAKSHNMCPKHTERWRAHGDPNVIQNIIGEPERRFWMKVDKESAAPCWLWTGWVAENGYGRFNPSGGVRQAAHRWAYEQYVGPIPDGHEVDHVYANGCRHRSCVNPDHLEAVTPAENNARIPAHRRANQWTAVARHTP